jgi:hypothetical protein
VAYPGDAFSAAAIISMSCKEMVVRPDSRIGAAVIVHQASGGELSAVDAKMASPHHARQRQFMAASGRPYPLIAAMTIQETQLWWSPMEGFRTDKEQKESASQAKWEEIDGRSTILTMTADQALRWKIATGQASGIESALKQLGILDKVQIVRMDDAVSQHNKNLERKFVDLVTQFNNYFNAISGLVKSLNELRAAYEKKNRAAASQLKSDISKQVAKLSNAGRAIQKIDKSLLARRIEVPDQALEQIEADAQILSRLNRLLRTDTIDGFNESADRMNTVLESWRKLLK